jgi:hypothetical protein
VPNFAGTNTKAPVRRPPVKSTGGNFLSQPALVGQLLIVTPVEVVHGVYNEGKSDERPTRRLKADVVVLTGEHAGNHPNLLLSGKPIVDAGEEILEDEVDTPVADRTVLAGRLTRKALKKYKDNWSTPEKLEAAIADPNVVVPNNAYSWLIPTASKEDMDLVTAYYENGATEPTPSNEDEVDEFGD